MSHLLSGERVIFVVIEIELKLIVLIFNGQTHMTTPAPAAAAPAAPALSLKATGEIKPVEGETKPEENPENPPAAEEGRATSKSKKGKGKKEKKPKKKKLSRKELARLKKEKLEQELREQQRREAELKDQREKEYEQRKRQEQQQRLEEEDRDINKLREQRADDGKRIRATKAHTDDWEIFTQCDHFIDVRYQADVNTFITQWREFEDVDLPGLFEHIHQSNMILTQLIQMMQNAEVSQEIAEYERCKSQIAEIRELINQKIELITIRHLVFSDKFAGAKNEVQVSCQADGISFGMWVNLSKNPRNKEIEFPGLTIEIPKAVAMTSIAIRMLMLPNKPFDEQFLFIDRLIQCEFLQLPTPPKRIGTMTLRQSPHKNALVNISYPLRNITAAQPPLNFKVQLDPGCLTDYVKDATVVMIQQGSVVSQHISKIAVDQENNEVAFSSMAVGVFGIAIPRYSHFPLQFWEITSTSETSIEIYVRTQLVELAIDINAEGRCSMESPFSFSNLTPVAAVEFMMERGINIIAPKEVDGITPKRPDLEAVLAQGLADVVTGFVVTWSKWNSSLPPDRAMLIMREQVDFNDLDIDQNEPEPEPAPPQGVPEEPEPEAPPPTEPQEGEIATQTAKNPMKALLVKANHITEVPNAEDLEQYNLTPLEDAQIHQHLLPMFFEHAKEEVQKRVRNAPSFLCDATLYFLKQLRLFSMSQ